MPKRVKEWPSPLELPKAQGEVKAKLLEQLGGDEELDVAVSGMKATRDGLYPLAYWFMQNNVPLGVLGEIYVKRAESKGFWGRLWERFAHWVMRRAGYKNVYP